MKSTTKDPLESKLEHLSFQVAQLTEIIRDLKDPGVKYVLTVEELAQRWSLCPEAVRRLVREKRLRPLREFRPYRFTLEEIRSFESGDKPRFGSYASTSKKGGRR